MIQSFKIIKKIYQRIINFLKQNLCIKTRIFVIYVRTFYETLSRIAIRSKLNPPPPPGTTLYTYSLHGCEWNSSFIQTEAGTIQRGPPRGE